MILALTSHCLLAFLVEAFVSNAWSPRFALAQAPHI